MFLEADSVSHVYITNIRFRSVTQRATYSEAGADLADAEFKAFLEIDGDSDAANSENVVESILNELDDIDIDFYFIQPATLQCTAILSLP